MSLSPKLVAVLGFFQVVFIAVGYFATCAFLHTFEAEHAGIIHEPIPLPPLAAFIRSFGLWFTAVPVVWAGFTVARAENNWGVISIARRDALLGIVLTVGAAVLFGASAWQAFANLGSGPIQG